MPWRENKPDPDDQLRELGEVIRSRKSEFRDGLEKHFFWTESSNASAGEPRLADGSDVAGTARAHFAAASTVSADRDGKLFVASDTTRLYGLTSGESFLLGSRRAIFADGQSAATITQNARRLIQSGLSGGALLEGQERVDFPIAYTGDVPQVQIQISGCLGTTLLYTASVSAVNTSGFSVDIIYQGIPADPGNAAFFWRSDGTVALV